MIECTFWSDDMSNRAQHSGHICWSDLFPFIKDTPKSTFVLFHVSQRYTWKHVQGIVDASGLPNIVIWKDDDDDNDNNDAKSNI
jgi:hypothetical protein